MTKLKNSCLILLLLAVIFGISAGVFVFGRPEAAYASSEDDKYAFHNGSATVTVDENKFLHIEENLTVAFIRETKYFTRAVHGKVKSYFNLNGTALKGRSFLSRISNLSAEIDGSPAEAELNERNGKYQTFTVTKTDGGFAEWVKGESEKYYNIKLSYVLDFSDDIDGKSTFYYNPFVTYDSRWFYFDGDKKDVSTLTVTVNLPSGFKEKDAALLKGGRKTDGLTLNSENSVTAVVPFKDIDGYALRVMLPENTFDTSVEVYPFYWAVVGAVAVLMLFGGVYAFIYRARRPLAPVEYEPPILNPMHFSAFWHGYARRRDLCTVILQWAQLGCIKIKKDGKKDLILTKIKKLPDGRPPAEYGYFNALFEGCGVYGSKAVRGKDKAARNRIACAATELVKEFGEPVTRARGVETAKLVVMFSSFLTLVFSFAYFIFIAGDIAYALVLALALPFVIGFAVKILYTIVSNSNRLKNTDKQTLRVTSLLGLVGMFPLIFFVYIITASHYMPVYDYIHVTLISVLWIVFCVFAMPKLIAKRTDEAQETYGRMLGFKKFLTMAKVSEMEVMLEQNPDYYLDVLPYCMIMGLSKKLDKKTEFLAAPEWADGFEAKRFASSMFSSVKHSVITRKKKVKK